MDEPNVRPTSYVGIVAFSTGLRREIRPKCSRVHSPTSERRDGSTRGSHRGAIRIGSSENGRRGLPAVGKIKPNGTLFPRLRSTDLEDLEDQRSVGV